MARKARTPPPPRRPVQAPKVRSGGAGQDVSRRQRLAIYALAASGIVMLGIAVLVIWVLGRSGD
ncbi:MAG: hypothetical protein H0V79_00620, partial [Actinobacteria bacterium]|nr:hypothetical protein [Actinomycetota bacterium]